MVKSTRVNLVPVPDVVCHTCYLVKILRTFLLFFAAAKYFLRARKKIMCSRKKFAAHNFEFAGPQNFLRARKKILRARKTGPQAQKYWVGPALVRHY